MNKIVITITETAGAPTIHILAEGNRVHNFLSTSQYHIDELSDNAKKWFVPQPKNKEVPITSQLASPEDIKAFNMRAPISNEGLDDLSDSF